MPGTIFLLVICSLLCGCSSHPSRREAPTAEIREKVAHAFWKAAEEVRRAHEMPLGASGSSWATFNIPVSAEPILNLGPNAIPVLNDLRKTKDWRTGMLADACISILEGKRVARQGTFRSSAGGIEFVTYSVSE